MDETRQNPEQILKQIEKEEQSLNRGHLKIFFGYAAGCAYLGDEELHLTPLNINYYVCFQGMSARF